MYKSPVKMMDRVTRNYLIRSTDQEWLDVIEIARDQGILSEYLGDLVEFNEAASQYSGTIREFLNEGK